MNYKKKQKLQEGFSLIEILVVLALLVIMMTISLFNYDRFGKETELENSVYSVALAIRETQTVGINKGVRDGVNNRIDSVRKTFGGSYGYGIHFRTIELRGTTKLDKTHFAFFVDNSLLSKDDKEMTGRCDLDSECYSVISIDKGNYISSIKVKDSNSG
jgi:prepilin-type N-terminal cleavage/methylation domain-containing protein